MYGRKLCIDHLNFSDETRERVREKAEDAQPDPQVDTGIPEDEAPQRTRTRAKTTVVVRRYLDGARSIGWRTEVHRRREFVGANATVRAERYSLLGLRNRQRSSARV